MSAQTRMETALASIRTTTRAIVVKSLAGMQADFVRVGTDIKRRFSTKKPLTSEQSTKMRTAVVAGLTQIARGVQTRTVDSTGQVVSDVADELLGAHHLAALDEDVEVPDLGERFAGITLSAVARLERAHGRTHSLPALIKHYQDAAIVAIGILLSRAVARQIAEEEVAKDVATILAGGDVSYGKYGLAREQTTGLRTFLPYSQRITISETFNTMREATAVGMDAGGFVLAAQWTLSPHHTVVDKCDEIALDNVGLGKGIYLVSDWPEAPHPYCACSMGSPLVFHPQNQW